MATSATTVRKGQDRPRAAGPRDLPPITIEHVIGVTGAHNEPVIAEHLNTGISTREAQAFTAAAAPHHPKNTQAMLEFAVYSSAFAGVAGVATSILLTFNHGNPDIALPAVALCGAALLALILAVAVGGTAIVRKRRYERLSAAFKANVITVLRNQGKLIPLPLIDWTDHGDLVAKMIEDLETARAYLTEQARDGHAPLLGGPELLAALGALGDYARAEYEDRPKYEAARDSARAFMAVAHELSRHREALEAKASR